MVRSTNRILHGEISMRHFPDLSDTSFQIPLVQDAMLTEALPGELDFDAFDDSAMGGLDDDPFTTPMLKKRVHSPLTLSEITPRGEKTAAGPPVHLESAALARRDKVKEKENEKQKPYSVRSVLPKKESIDDMFQRRKRDNYQQMGIDLTSKSTARLRHDKKNIDETIPTTGGPEKVEETVEQYSRAAETQTAPKIRAKRPVPKDAGIVRHKPPSSSTQSTRPKSILKPSKPTNNLPESTLSRTLTTLSHTPKAERPKWGDVVAEVQGSTRRRNSSGSGIGIVGGGLIDVLVKYGEKLKGSFGFSSSSSLHGSPDRGRPAQHLAGPSSKPLTLSELTPARTESRRQRDALTLSGLTPSRQTRGDSEVDGNGCSVDEQLCLETSPMRPSRKRTSSRSPTNGNKKGRVGSNPNLEPSRAESTSSSSNASGMRGGRPVAKSISKPRPLGPSNAVNSKTHSHPKAQSTNVAAAAKPHIRSAVSSHDLTSKSHKATGARTQCRRADDKEQHPPISLTMPSGPAFASDVHRHRAFEKTRRERETREQEAKQRRNFKASTMPHFTKPAPPARPTARPTVPAAFAFRSDARAVQRNAEFEEKRKTWESRAIHQALPMPDFPSIHAAQAEAARNRRVVPVLPTEAPQLTTMVRAKEREKFEEERREREKAMEKLREMREKEREEQEERAYREARKRTIPRANEVPEWYKDLPKRKEVD